MQKKRTGWKVKGMNRDLSVSSFNQEFAFENKNLRLVTNDNNTLLSWVNEKKPQKITPLINETPWVADEIPTNYAAVPIKGAVIGTAVLNQWLVLFTHDLHTSRPDSIYVFWWSNKDKEQLLGKVLYNGNLNFSIDYPLETSTYFEANHIQKVYWTDGLNQPRLINIVEDNEKLDTWHTSYTESGVMPQEYWFDFVPSVELDDVISVEKTSTSGGTFAPGVIQYCFTYINKYGQQTNIINVSPMFYLAHKDRGGSPEDRVSAVFDVEITHADNHFDYIRLYSIQRTSLDATPIVRHLDDIKIEAHVTRGSGGQAIIDYYYAHYTDNGTTGEAMDPTELLYVGGKEITALTMADKDNTLFLGNLTQKNASLQKIQDYFDDNRENIDIEYHNDINLSGKRIILNRPTGVYSYTPTFDNNSYEITSFKGGETYRFGFQLQKYTGEWSEPVFLNDVTNSKYPNASLVSNTVYLPYATAEIDIEDVLESLPEDERAAFYTTYKRIRPVIVYPNMNDRSVLCQGVLNPTVFNVEDRKEKYPYSQASWYYRPYIWDLTGDDGYVNFVHYSSLFAQNKLDPTESNYLEKAKRVEIQGSSDIYSTPYSTSVDTQEIDPETAYTDTPMLITPRANTQFFVDQSIITLNSPDIEFDTDVQLASMDNVKLRIIGMVPLTATASSHSIYTSSAMLELGRHQTDESVKHIKLKKRIGDGEMPINVMYTNNNNAGGHLIPNYAGYKLVSNFLWNDSAIEFATEDEDENPDGVLTFTDYFVNHLIFPWHRNGSLSNDFRSKDAASSVLDTKKESNLIYSAITPYFQPNSISATEYTNISAKMFLTENAEIFNMTLPKQGTNTSDINYYPNIDKILYNNNGYLPIMEHGGAVPVFYPEDLDRNKDYFTPLHDPISMKYKSTSHAVIALNESSGLIPILPAAIKGSGTGSTVGAYGGAGSSAALTFWGDTEGFTQSAINISNLYESGSTSKYNFLWLGELYRTDVTNAFGDVKTNNWLIAGPVEKLPASEEDTEQEVTLKWLEGDTYYQRYDSLKTYAFTKEDPNQIVEILSFMCETHVNLDGRYDKQRGQTKAYDMSPEIFNLINPVYSQKDNFFLSQKIDVDELDNFMYPNMITYSKAKESGADVDLWTNVTLASVLELDGDKGAISSLERLNDQIIAFQDKGISQILYNENAQISTAQGVPIELGNSGKVQGKRYLSDKVGCSNKWSITKTQAGIYFMDSNNKGIYLFNGQVQDLSSSKGFNTWSKQNIPSAEFKWNPVTYNTTTGAPTGFNNFVSYYDKLNQEVLFISKDTCLAYSEKLGYFTSFYDYQNQSYFDNFNDIGLWSIVKTKPIQGEEQQFCFETELAQHQAGNYFDYSMTLVGNPEPTEDKLFTNLEFRATVDGDMSNNKFLLPFDTLEAWDEYQHGITTLENKMGRAAMEHHTKDVSEDTLSSALKRKFRVWMCDIPRDNYPAPESDNERGIYRTKVSPMNRIRNPWAYLKLTKNPIDPLQGVLPRAEIHDIILGYFV